MVVVIKLCSPVEVERGEVTEVPKKCWSEAMEWWSSHFCFRRWLRYALCGLYAEVGRTGVYGYGWWLFELEVGLVADHDGARTGDV